MEIWPQMPVGVLNRSLGRALEWHSRGQRFDPAYLHQKHSISLEIECFSILFSLFCTGRFCLGQQMDNRPSQFLLSYCGKEEVMASVKEEIITPDSPSPGARLSFTPDIFSASSCGRWPPAGRLLLPEVGLFKLRRICYTKYLGKTFALRGVR